MEQQALGRFVYITGADGTGKTTQTNLIFEFLQNRCIKCQQLWLRFPFFFSLPLLLYARLRGHSWHEIVDGQDYGYWDFQESLILRVLLPWFVLLDLLITSIVKIQFPILRGEFIICERFIIDIIVDLIVAFNDKNFHRRLPAKIYPYLLPRDGIIILLDLDSTTIRNRRTELRADRRLDTRLEVYRFLAKEYDIESLSSKMSVDEVSDFIINKMKITNE